MSQSLGQLTWDCWALPAGLKIAVWTFRLRLEPGGLKTTPFAGFQSLGSSLIPNVYTEIYSPRTQPQPSPCCRAFYCSVDIP